MNCGNCGAAMELVDSRRYFQCRHCGTFHFPELVEADGIRIVGPTADAPTCSVCKAPMEMALLDKDHPIHFCGRCRGALLPRTTFATVINKRRAWATGAPAEPVPLDRRAIERELACPSCHKRFETYPHYGPGNVVIDSCVGCDVIWLDFGEMRQIVDAPGRDRGSRQLPPVDDDFVRKGTSSGEDAPDPDEPLNVLFDLLFNR